MTKMTLKAKILTLSFTVTFIILSLSGCGLEAKKSSSNPSNPSPTVLPIGTVTPTPTPTPLPIGSPDLSPITYRLDNLDKQIINLQTQITELGAKVNTLSSGSPSSVTITQLQSQITALQSQLTMYYSATSDLFRVASSVTSDPHYIGSQNTALTCKDSLSQIAQSFTATSTGVFSGINGLFARTGDPKTIMFHLAPMTASGFVSSTYLSTASFDSSLLTNSYSQWTHIPMPPVNIISGTKYAIIVECPRADSSNWVGWSADAINPNYPEGAAYLSKDNGKTWAFTTPDTDATFVVNIA